MRRAYQIVNKLTGVTVSRGPLLSMERQLPLYIALYERFQIAADLDIQVDIQIAPDAARLAGAL